MDIRNIYEPIFDITIKSFRPISAMIWAKKQEQVEQKPDEPYPGSERRREEGTSDAEAGFLHIPVEASVPQTGYCTGLQEPEWRGHMDW